jgi:parallel beta-helix repeat protein
MKMVSGTMLMLLLTGVLVLVFDVQTVMAMGTIYIRADGSIDPPTAPIQRDGDVYALIGDITSDADGIVIERNNMTLDGAGYTVKGLEGGTGIFLSERTNVTIKRIRVQAFYYGIHLQASNVNNICESLINGNIALALWLQGSSTNNISRNNISNGISLNVYPVPPYWDLLSNGNNICENNIMGLVSMEHSAHNNIAGNDIKGGIYLLGSEEGHTTYDNDIFGNNITQGWVGAYFEYAHDNTICENNITDNRFGVALVHSYGSIFCHNNFVNTYEVSLDPDSRCSWDDGYPSGGNYWSDYSGVDLYSGPYQNETGSDGIGDTPRVIDSRSRDRYPFMNKNGWWNNTKLDFCLSPNPAYVGQTVTLFGNLSDMLGHPVSNTAINVYVNGTFNRNLYTNSSGWFTAASKVNTAGTYNITVVFNGSGTIRQSFNNQTLSVLSKIDTKVWFSLSPNPAVKGQPITLTGNLTDQYGSVISNASVEVLYSIDNGINWIYAGTLQTNSTGWFKATGKLTLVGDYLIKIRYKGTSMYNPSYHIEILTIIWS